jgi:hypothetical protein
MADVSHWREHRDISKQYRFSIYAIMYSSCAPAYCEVRHTLLELEEDAAAAYLLRHRERVAPQAR